MIHRLLPLGVKRFAYASLVTKLPQILHYLTAKTEVRSTLVRPARPAAAQAHLRLP